MTAVPRVKRILAAECKLALPKPIRLGPVEVKTRDFVALRLESDNGLFGDAISYPRGANLLYAAHILAPHIVGTSSSKRRETIENTLQRLVNNRASLVKAASLYDIALWDLFCKSVSQPLHAVLGGIRSQVPVMVVAGYFLDQRTIEDVCEEVRLRVDQGYRLIKIMINGSDPDQDERLVAAAMNIAGSRICVDAHWAWTSVAAALETCKRLDGYNVKFIEDPFGQHQSFLAGELQKWIKTPLAVGEDLPDLQTIHAAIEPLLFYRLDATTCGGISTAVTATESAGVRGKSVLPHVFLPLHAQLAGALRPIEAVEFIPPEIGACPMFDLLDSLPRINDGILDIDPEPGAGFHLDWDKVAATAGRVWVHDIND